MIADSRIYTSPSPGPGAAGGYTHYFKSACFPKVPSGVTVLAVERRVCYHMDVLALGEPLVSGAERSVKATLDSVVRYVIHPGNHLFYYYYLSISYVLYSMLWDDVPSPDTPSHNTPSHNTHPINSPPINPPPY